MKKETTNNIKSKITKIKNWTKKIEKSDASLNSTSKNTPWIILIHQLLKTEKLFVHKNTFDEKSQFWNIPAIKIFFQASKNLLEKMKNLLEKILDVRFGNQSRKPSFVPWTDWGRRDGGHYRLRCSSTRALRRKGICWRLDRRAAGEYFCLAYLQEGVMERILQEGVMERICKKEWWKMKNVLWKTFSINPRSSRKRKPSYTFFPIIVGVLAPSLVLGLLQLHAASTALFILREMPSGLGGWGRPVSGLREMSVGSRRGLI